MSRVAAPAVLEIPLRFPHGIVRSAPRPKAVTVFRKRRIENRLQHLQQQLLNKGVEHSRNAQLPHPTPALRYPLALHHGRPVAPR